MMIRGHRIKNTRCDTGQSDEDEGAMRYDKKYTRTESTLDMACSDATLQQMNKKLLEYCVHLAETTDTLALKIIRGETDFLSADAVKAGMLRIKMIEYSLEKKSTPDSYTRMSENEVAFLHALSLQTYMNHDYFIKQELIADINSMNFETTKTFEYCKLGSVFFDIANHIFYNHRKVVIREAVNAVHPPDALYRPFEIEFDICKNETELSPFTTRYFQDTFREAVYSIENMVCTQPSRQRAIFNLNFDVKFQRDARSLLVIRWQTLDILGVTPGFRNALLAGACGFSPAYVEFVQNPPCPVHGFVILSEKCPESVKLQYRHREFVCTVCHNTVNPLALAHV